MTRPTWKIGIFILAVVLAVYIWGSAIYVSGLLIERWLP